MTRTVPISPVATCKDRFRFASSERAKSIADWGQNAIDFNRRYLPLSFNNFTVEVIWNGTFVELWETDIFQQNNECYRKCLSDAILATGDVLESRP